MSEINALDASYPHLLQTEPLQWQHILQHNAQDNFEYVCDKFINQKAEMSFPIAINEGL